MFNELKDIYLKQYSILTNIEYESNIDSVFTTQKEELELGEGHYMTYYNLSDLQESILEIGEYIKELTLGSLEIEDFIEQGRLCRNELI